MEQEIQNYSQIKKYLEHLGYPSESIIPEYQSQFGTRIDFAIKTDKGVLVVIELKKNLDIDLTSREEIGYHPITRKLQKEAADLGAKY